MLFRSNTVNGDGCSSACQCENIQCALGSCAGTVVTGTASGLPVAIPDNMPLTPATVTIPIAATGTITKMVVGFGATHTYDSDLDIVLTSPAATNVDVCSDNGADGDNFTGTYFKDGAQPVTGGAAPFTGIFAPEAPFSVFTGTSVTGNWTLKVGDDAALDTGSVTSYTIAFCVTP